MNLCVFKALNLLSDIVDKMDESTISANTETLMCLLYYRPSFSDINFQVVSKALLIAQKIAYHSTQFTYRHAAYVMESACDKLVDPKLKKAITETLGIFSEVLGPQTIFSLLYKHTGNHKNPKVISEALLYMASAVQEFGLHTIDLNSLIDFVKITLESPNPHVKHSAIILLTEIYKWTGVGLRDNLKDIKPTLLSVIDQEFDKVSGTKPATPTRHVRNSSALSRVTFSLPLSAGEKTPTIRETKEEERSSSTTKINTPRIDISSRITPQLLQNMEDQDWKKRQEALQQVEQIINDTNKHIQPKLGGTFHFILIFSTSFQFFFSFASEVFIFPFSLFYVLIPTLFLLLKGLIPALKKRLVDTNKNLTVLALNILGDLATAVGPAIESQLKLIATAILNNFTVCNL
jgi:cytoskeleton-associated protein 5